MTRPLSYHVLLSTLLLCFLSVNVNVVQGFSIVSTPLTTARSVSCSIGDHPLARPTTSTLSVTLTLALFGSSRNQDRTIRDEPTVVGDDWETAQEVTTTTNSNSTNSTNSNSKVLRFLEVKYPTFYKLLVRDNDALVKELQSTEAHTLLVPNEDAFQALGAKKLQQLLDPRNQEIRDKTGQFHVIAGKAVSATELRTEDWTKGRPKDGSKPNTVISAIVTLGGEVPVGRSKSGGYWFGIGAKEDGDIVIGPKAQIVGSYQVENCLVHEMDDLISPLALWRYVDQLRIPGF